MKSLMSQSPLSLIAVIQYIQVIGVFQQMGLENSSNSAGRYGLRKSSQIDSHLPGGGNNCLKTRGRVCQLSIALILINN